MYQETGFTVLLKVILLVSLAVILFASLTVICRALLGVIFCLRKVYASLSLSIKLPKAISRAAGAYHREAISRGESRI